MEPTTPWTLDRPVRSPFALPSGLLGRIAGRIMLRTNKPDDLLDLLDVQPGEQVLEVGYGPGALIRLLRQTSARRICGVDPSPAMRDLATRPHRAEIAGGRIDLRLGTAAGTGFGDAEFDCVVSVNNVAIWPDLQAGLGELHRVTRPGGRVVVAWHGGLRPSRIARRLNLPEEKLARIEQELHDLFSGVHRHESATLTVWAAVR